MTDFEKDKLMFYQRKAQYVYNTYFSDFERSEYRSLIHKYVEENAAQLLGGLYEIFKSNPYSVTDPEYLLDLVPEPDTDL